MEKITLDAKGKINLLLDVTARRENGYHDIATIMQSVKLSDTVTVCKNDSGGITLKTNFDDIVAPEDNIAYKAMLLMKEEFSLSCGFDATIEKNIPIAGGMGGGSTNAAAIIKAINELCGLGLTLDELCVLGLKLGADVPFCIFEKTALAKGVGEELCQIDGLKNVKILIVNPRISVSTKTVYELVDTKCELGKIDTDAAVSALKNRNIDTYSSVFINIMETVTAEICPEVREIIEKLKELGAKHAMMSGSGPTCFGIFDGDVCIKKAEECFDGYFVSLTEPA